MSSTLRNTNLEKLTEQVYDVLIIGGGINGAVAAAALAGRGVRVALIEREDFASGVSSNSSNLAWGGIKYLESHEYLLVNKLCKSRNELMRAYPSTVKEIRFFTTIARGFRFWSFFVYLGALLYWLMGRCKTAPPRYFTARQLEAREPVVNTENAAGGLEYSDCYLYDNDARFVFNFVRTALNYGCIAANYVESLGNRKGGDLWFTSARDTMTGKEFQIRSRVLINACGPYVDDHNRMTGEQTRHHHLFSKGIHLIVDRVTDNKRVLTFFASDGRLFFLIPMGPKTCIGTTDTQVADPEVGVTDEDRQFVLDNVNALLDLELSLDDVVAERVGVRPLAIEGEDGVADWVKLSRKHVIETNTQSRHLSIFGGKLTDCLNVGDEVVEQVQALGVRIPNPEHCWYGEPSASQRAEFMLQARLMQLDALTDPSSPEPLSERFWRRYGTAAFGLLERIREDESCARLLIENAEYTRCEIELAARREMITRLSDFMRRRSKIELVVRWHEIESAPGLREACELLFGDQAEQRLQEYLREGPGQ
ncbi:FAD-dependent oxidoreductase [Halioglobus japonicus]|uniref:Glycerol-3-phosphate dehydrogenase/oxidase n=1 Tax=Halioglobus japonicus TaxID=930805 RepID=A0AAP8SMG9_9GAMM|nr:glycerol-3-phosphate dehydrogenase/oxidase [Halioglobus japonicus]AQA17623.1 FAD-dependent oxidoreductase [Halioglobus japonicus]PLW85562.1 glycerol-3-phosphate dehydrogenase/oxidase [Halioglobus japonicus]GHD16284.1 FAD-dependent oxidoreductase [Halioglobus japonicus]